MYLNVHINYPTFLLNRSIFNGEAAPIYSNYTVSEMLGSSMSSCSVIGYQRAPRGNSAVRITCLCRRSDIILDVLTILQWFKSS